MKNRIRRHKGNKTLVLRVDIDFRSGLERGVPALLDDLKSHGVHAGFYVVMGPDTMYKHSARFRERGYLKYFLSLNPLKIMRSFGLRDILAGRLLPPKPVGPSYPRILGRIVEEGHDLGVHGFDHYWWAANAFSADAGDLRDEIDRAWEAFVAVTGREPVTWASPSWKTTDEVIRHLAGKGVPYLVECRGETPFFTQLGDGSCVRVPHLPINLPALNELMHLGHDARSAVEELLRQMEGRRYNMLVVHGFYEGMMARPAWRLLCENLARLDYRIVSPSDYLKAHRGEIGDYTCSPLKRAVVEGGVSSVSHQSVPERTGGGAGCDRQGS